ATQKSPPQKIQLSTPSPPRHAMGRAKLALRDDDKAERLSRLQKRKVHLDDLHPTLRPLVVGDFLTLKYPTKKLLQVIQSHKTALLLQHLLPQNPRPWLMHLLADLKVASQREAAAVALTAMETSKRMRRLGHIVFSLLWREIAELAVGSEYRHRPVPKSATAKMAKRCNEVFSFTERRHISWELSARDLKADVAFEMETADPEEDYMELLSGEAFGWLWRVVKSFPEYRLHQKETLKARISQFLQQNKDGELPSILTAEFEKHGIVPSPRISQTVAEFGSGFKCCPPQRVVAISHLLTCFPNTCFEHVMDLQRVLNHAVFSERLGWMEAAVEIENSKEFKPSSCLL
ncbi:hypothetical protein HDU96_010320, partial [Phlyctochytrium bullatum]